MIAMRYGFLLREALNQTALWQCLLHHITVASHIYLIAACSSVG